MFGKKTETKDLLKTRSKYYCVIQIWKVLSTRITNLLPFLISSNQTSFVKNRFISESGRVISGFLEIANTLALEGFF